MYMYTHPKTKMTIEKQPFENVAHIYKMVIFPLSCYFLEVQVLFIVDPFFLMDHRTSHWNFQRIFTAFQVAKVGKMQPDIQVTGSWRSWWSRQCKPRLCVKGFNAPGSKGSKKGPWNIANPKCGTIFRGCSKALGKCLFTNHIFYYCEVFHFDTPWHCIPRDTLRCFFPFALFFQPENLWGPQNLAIWSWSWIPAKHLVAPEMLNHNNHFENDIYEFHSPFIPHFFWIVALHVQQLPWW